MKHASHNNTFFFGNFKNGIPLEENLKDVEKTCKLML
jgi:hypothetical protein